tara:strand:- start:344 stop:943 length:600 start_codon:yes stop_codon:yes gene_type:complete
MNTNYLDIWYLNSVWSLLSSISSGDKISIKGNLVTVEKNHPFLWMKRKYNGDSRVDVYQLIDNLFTMSEYHLKENGHVNKNVTSFKYNIILGIQGLLNLRDTYIDDNRFLSIFNSSLEKIKILKKYYKEEDEINQFTGLEGKIFINNNFIVPKSSNRLNIDNKPHTDNSHLEDNSHIENKPIIDNTNSNRMFRLKNNKN